MHFIFVINGRHDKAFIQDEVRRQIGENALTDYELYVTQGVGDGTRFVRIWCDLHSGEACCFVACGGSGTVNEVANGIAGSIYARYAEYKNSAEENKVEAKDIQDFDSIPELQDYKVKCLAIMAYGSTNDFCKCFPELDFKNLALLLKGKTRKMDIIKANDSYALNVINIGFSAEAAAEASRLIEEGKPKKAYSKGVAHAIFHSRFNDIRIMIDGHLVNTRCILTADIANGQYCGGQYKCAPNAEPDDGWMEVCVMRPMLLLSFLKMLEPYAKGTHLTDPFCLDRLSYCRTKHLFITSKDLVTLCLDGEIVVSSQFKVDILEKSITLLLPSKDNIQTNK